MYRFIFVLLLNFLSCAALHAGIPRNSSDGVDIILFSYNRPLQLYSCLESIERYFSGFNEIHVVYRASNPAYATGYEGVWEKFAYVKSHPQGINPKEDFKPLVLSSVYSPSSKAAYVMFGVDDDVVTDFVFLTDCVNHLEKYHVWGFFLRLGKNINYTYPLNKFTPCPQGNDQMDGVFTWKFNDGTGDWAYPNNVDMTIYRKKDITAFLNVAMYVNPNTFEGIWASRWAHLQQRGICYPHSKIINIPMNLVNEAYSNRYGHLYTPEQLLAKWQQGLKIDISQFYKIENKALHNEYEPHFIAR